MRCSREPDGIARAFIIGEKFIDGQACALILGDNVYYGAGLGEMVQRAAARRDGATVFCHWVNNPSRYGVLDLDAQNRPIRIEEKPKQPKSNWAVTGLYFYDASIVEVARRLKPSARGELEITDANRVYLEAGHLSVEKLGRGFAWFDAGTHQSLLQASEFIYTIEERQGLKIGCPEEIAYRMGFIDDAALERLATAIDNSEYSGYLRRLPTASVRDNYQQSMSDTHHASLGPLPRLRLRRFQLSCRSVACRSPTASSALTRYPERIFLRARAGVLQPLQHVSAGRAAAAGQDVSRPLCVLSRARRVTCRCISRHLPSR